MSTAGIFAIQGKYLGECSTNGPVGKYFTIVYFGMGIATMTVFVMLEIIWGWGIMSKAKLMFWGFILSIALTLSFYLL